MEGIRTDMAVLLEADTLVGHTRETILLVEVAGEEVEQQLRRHHRRQVHYLLLEGRRRQRHLGHRAARHHPDHYLQYR